MTAPKEVPAGSHDDDWRHNDVTAAYIVGSHQLQPRRRRDLLRQQGRLIFIAYTNKVNGKDVVTKTPPVTPVNIGYWYDAVLYDRPVYALQCQAYTRAKRLIYILTDTSFKLFGIV